MKAAILSDSHDNIQNLEKSLEQILGKVEVIIHCGDIVSSFSIETISKVSLPTYIFFGNNDGDISGLIEKAGKNIKWTPIRKEFGEIDLEDRKIAFCHYKAMAEFLARTKNYDAVFYGHTHKSEKRIVGKTLLLNPGAVCGIQDGKTGIASYAIYDTQTNFADIITIK